MATKHNSAQTHYWSHNPVCICLLGHRTTNELNVRRTNLTRKMGFLFISRSMQLGWTFRTFCDGSGMLREYNGCSLVRAWKVRDHINLNLFLYRTVSQCNDFLKGVMWQKTSRLLVTTRAKHLIVRPDIFFSVIEQESVTIMQLVSYQRCCNCFSNKYGAVKRLIPILLAASLDTARPSGQALLN